jgi:hypothetical protein
MRAVQMCEYFQPWRFSVRQALVVSLLLCCWGCGKSDGLDRAAVAGKVTLDGAPVATGTIVFYPTGDTKGPTTGGNIEDGQYSISLAKGPIVGRNRVEIRATRTTGRKVQAPMAERGVLTDEIVEAVPARYNSSSTLKHEIKSGDNTLDFNLTTR